MAKAPRAPARIRCAAYLRVGVISLVLGPAPLSPPPMSIPPPQVARALAELLGSALAHDVPVTVPRLGTFWRQHRPGRVVTHQGRPALAPPSDDVAFDPQRR